MQSCLLPQDCFHVLAFNHPQAFSRVLVLFLQWSFALPLCIFGPLDSLFVGRDLVFNFFVSLFLTPESDDVRLPFAVMGRHGWLYKRVEVIFCISFAFSRSKARRTVCWKKRGFGGERSPLKCFRVVFSLSSESFVFSPPCGPFFKPASQPLPLKPPVEATFQPLSRPFQASTSRSP